MNLDEVQIELTGICNATCVYCTWEKRTVGKQHMKRDLALRLLDEAKSLGVNSIRYHGLGESLLHPNLIEIMFRGEELAFNHSISTNCFNLKGKLAEEIGKLKNLSLILAIPWVMHDKFVNVCVNNVLDYLTLSSENKQVNIQMVCHENAQAHYHRAVETFLPYVERRANAFLHLKQPVTWPNDSPNKGFINHELVGHHKVIHDTRETPLSIGKGCAMPERFLMVLADGTCVPCCVGMDSWKLENIESKTLREIWESPRMHEIRRMWREKQGDIPCTYCQNREDCIT